MPHTTLLLEVPNRDKIYSSQMLIRETITNLIVIDMLNFDMILGMDFLNIYKVKIDYRKNKVKFTLGSSE